MSSSCRRTLGRPAWSSIAALVLMTCAGCTSSEPDTGAGAPAAPGPTATIAAPVDANQVEALDLGAGAFSMKYGFGAAWVQVDPPVEQVAKIDAGRGAVSLAVDGGRAVTFTSDAVWVAVRGEELEKRDPDSGQLLLTVPFTGSYLAAGHGSIWGTTGEGLVRLDEQSGEVLSTILIPDVGGLTDVDVSDAAVWVTAKGSGTVIRVDPATDTVVDVIPTGTGAHDLVIDDNGLWVTNFRDNTVSRLDVDTGEVVATIEGVGSGVGIDSSGDAVWASRRGSGIYRIDPATNAATLAVKKDGWSYGIAYGDGALWISSTGGTVTRLAVPGA